MMYLKKSALLWIVLLAAFGSFFALTGSASAETASAVVVSDAQLVTQLGIMQGDDSGAGDSYLNKPTTRIQAAIMFLRLKGLEQEALAFKGTDNFSDASQVWNEGQRVLAYLKGTSSLGWTGVGEGKFEPLAVIDAEQYYKVMLEVLGYKQDVDFEFKNVLETARAVGLGKAGDAKPFKNLHIATATVEALGTKIKGENKSLASALVELQKLNAEKIKALAYEKIEFSAKATLGAYFADGKGMTLYYFSKDLADPNSCQGKCLENWPVFYASELKVPAELNGSDFGVLTRADGTKQTTYKGWPLYYFINDKKAGDTNGEAVNNVWFVIDPAKLSERSNAKFYNVEIADFKFSVPELTIEAGSKVTFTNHDAIKHNASAVDGSFRTKLLAKGESETVSFSKAGVYDYVCEPHKKSMKAKIIVK